MIKPEILRRIEAFPGEVGFFWQDLETEETAAWHADRPLLAASVIKLPMMVEAFRQFEAGLLDPSMPVAIRREDKAPPCGVLTFLHDGLTVTVRDLVALSIIVSDNTATNLLMDLLGVEQVNGMLEAQGLRVTRLRRKMFDREAAARGLQNTIAAEEIGRLLAMMYRGEVVSPAACTEMLEILKGQQLESKMPFWFTDSTSIAHKTGEDEGISHDVGIVYGKRPFVLCLCGNQVDTPRFNRLIQDIAWELAQ